MYWGEERGGRLPKVGGAVHNRAVDAALDAGQAHVAWTESPVRHLRSPEGLDRARVCGQDGSQVREGLIRKLAVGVVLLLGVVCVWLFTAPTATAYDTTDPGYGDVIATGGNDLTGPAKTILTNPTFLAEEPAAASGAGFAADGAGLVSWLRSAGAIAIDASPWVGGAAAAATICNSFFGHCFGLFGSDPPKPPELTWNLVEYPTTITVGGHPAGYGTPAGAATQVPVYIGEYYAGPTVTAQDWEEVCGSSPNGVADATNARMYTTLWVGPTWINCGAVQAGAPVMDGHADAYTYTPQRTLQDSTATQPSGAVGTTYCTAQFTYPVCNSQVPPASQVTQGLAWCITHADTCGVGDALSERVGQWVASQVDANVPSPYVVPVPPPSAGETWSQYQTDLTNAGFTNVQRQILTSDTTDLDQPASAVTVVSPAPGTAIDTSRTVTVTTNPDTMPQPSQREIALANTLASQNTNVDATNKLDIARSCLELEDAGIPNTDTSGGSGDKSFTNCSSLPIFISGYDVREASQHDLEALGWLSSPNNAGQTVNPAWVELNRDVPNKPGDGWYTGKAPCTSPTPPGANCDEYPFYSTTQGGPGANLKYIDGNQNQLQGRILGYFYTSNTYTAYGQGCNLPTGQAFLAIPLPTGIKVNTTWACNAGHW